MFAVLHHSVDPAAGFALQAGNAVDVDDHGFRASEKALFGIGKLHRLQGKGGPVDPFGGIEEGHPVHALGIDNDFVLAAVDLMQCDFQHVTSLLFSYGNMIPFYSSDCKSKYARGHFDCASCILFANLNKIHLAIPRGRLYNGSKNPA